MEAALRSQLRVLGYRQTPDDQETGRLRFEKPLEVGAIILEWEEILRFVVEGRPIHPVRGTRKSGQLIPSLIEEFPRLHRQGWLAYHLDLVGPVRKLVADDKEWTLTSWLYWFAREGVSLDVAAESKERIGVAEFRELRRTGFLARLAPELRRRGLRSVSIPPHSKRAAPAFMLVGQSNMRPPRATGVLGRVLDWLRGK